MDATALMRDEVAEQAVTCDVLRDDDGTSYGDSKSNVGTVEVSIFDARGSSSVEPAGTEQDTNLAGLVVPEYDASGTLVETVAVADTLRPQSAQQRTYTVRAKVGLPSELDPELWQLSLSRA